MSLARPFGKWFVNTFWLPLVEVSNEHHWVGMASNAPFDNSKRRTEPPVQPDGHRPSTPELNQFFPAIRLFVRVWLVVALICSLGLGLWHFLTQDAKMRASIDMLTERALIGWQATSMVLDFMDAEQLAEIGKEFIIHDAILGGVVLGPTGHVLASFGHQPALTWEDGALRGETHRHDPGGQTLDISLDPSDTGLLHQIILRIPGPGHPLSKQGAALPLSEQLVQDVILSAFVAAGFGLLFLAFMLRPHALLQKAASSAVSNPKNVASARLKWRRNDTIGMTANAIDTLIARMHYLRESELAPLTYAFHKSGFPMMKFNANGRLSEANEAAAHFFDKENPSQLKDFDFQFTAIAEQTQGTPLALSRASKNGNFQGQIMVQVDSGDNKICFADITTMASAEARKNAAILVTLADATTFFTRLVKKEREAEFLDDDNREIRRLQLMQKRQLEAFACLARQQSDKNNGEPDKSVFISMERLINEWYHENSDLGDRPGDFEETALEAVSGDPEVVRTVVRQAYNTVFSKSGELAPRILVTSKLSRGGMAEFCIEHEPQPGAPKADYDDEIMNWTHNFKAFQKALTEAGGQLISFDPNAVPFKITMLLPAFRTAGRAGATIAGPDSSIRRAG
jgi:hypothetical protein